MQTFKTVQKLVTWFIAWLLMCGSAFSATTTSSTTTSTSTTSTTKPTTTTSPTVKLTPPSISIKVSASKSSAGEEFGSKILKSILYTPCLAEPKLFGAVAGLSGTNVTNVYDQLSITITGTNVNNNGDKYYDFDLYFFMVNLSSADIIQHFAGPQFAVARRFSAVTNTINSPGKFPSMEVVIRNGSENLDKADILLRKQDFVTANINEIILGGNIAVDAFHLPQGTWLAIAILGTSETFQADDPATWAVWDASPVILGSPWRTKEPQRTCE